MRKLYSAPLLILLLIGLGLLMATGPSALAQGENLLTNPTFEGQYASYVPNPPIADCPAGVCTTAQMPPGWLPWWVSRQATDPEWKNRMPEYKPAAPFAERIHAGSNAAQYFTFWGTHTAGLRQTVTVAPNARLRFTIWGHAWSNSGDEPLSLDPTPVNMRIGFDPTGDSNPFSPNVVWSGTANPYDNYVLFSVEAEAQGTQVTVFTYSAPAEPRKHNDIYWDNASLVIIGQGSAPPPPPPPSNAGDGSGQSAAPPAAAPIPVGPTSTPDAEGIIYNIVQPGDSLWAIAARAGISLDQLLDFNNLNKEDFIQVGQRLIIGRVQPGNVELAANEVALELEEEAEVMEATEEVEATTTPEPTAEAVALVAEQKTGGDICLKAFDDANQNGLHDAGEDLRPAVAFTISDGASVVSNYVTDGVSEPYCIQGLAAGNYRVTRSTVANEVLTTPGDWAISLADGTVLNLEFGSYIAAEEIAGLTMSAGADAPESAALVAAESGSLATESSGGLASGVVIAAVVLAVLLLLGVLVFILSARRTAL